MSIPQILATLSQSRALTDVDLGRLRRIQDGPTFLRQLISVYEHKAELYFECCEWDVKKQLSTDGVNQQSLEASTVGKTIEVAYSAFLQLEKVRLLPSLRATLAKVSPDLLSSLALIAGQGENNAELAVVAKRVFVTYAARYRLFQAVGSEALSALCQEAGNRVSAPFPLYLFHAMQQEKELADQIKAHPAHRVPEEMARLLAVQVQNQTQKIYECIHALLYYIGTVVDSAALSSRLRERHFHHLANPTGTAQFIDLIARGYLGEICQEQKQLEIIRDTGEVLCTKVAQVSLPALSLLDVQVEVDVSRWQSETERLRGALHETARRGAEYERELQAARERANQEIDRWRRNVPERPITFYASYGMHF